MSRELVDKLVRALLYEGYILYPYRPSVKNHQRWTFGGIYPKPWSEAQNGSDPWTMQTQLLVSQATASAEASLHVTVRFLHLIDRTVGRLEQPLAELPAQGEPVYQAVELMEVGGRRYQAWQEAQERQIDLGELRLEQLVEQPHQQLFSLPGSRAIEPLRAPEGGIAGILVRQQQPLKIGIEVGATVLEPGLYRIAVGIFNRSEMDTVATAAGRDTALMRSLVSTHTIIEVRDAAFVSMTDPPQPWREHAAGCNIGAWPVLVGQPPDRDTILSSPIILEDYPRVAPESPGDLFDATEIDEILTLRIMTLTDEEKQAAAGIDERTRDLLVRTEALARDQLLGLHGAVRGLRPVPPLTPPPEV